jgi:membrane-bound lytic murein transglycosylase D
MRPWRFLAGLLLGLLSYSATGAELWPRIFANYGLDHLQHPEIERWERHWRARAPQLRVILEERGHWLFPVVEAVLDRGWPAELALLPVIESQLQTQARSGRDAVGLWQFRRDAASEHGLAHTLWEDQRQHPLKATHAALDYLHTLHQRFGSWPLTLAAYNTGQTRLARVLRQARASSRSTAYWKLPLPAESRDYVPRLLGLARALPTIDRLPWIAPDRAPVVVATPGPIDLDAISDWLGWSLTELYAYNPHWSRWSMPPDTPGQVLLPRRLQQGAAEALANIPTAQRTRWLAWEVQAGDSLGVLAERWNTSVNLLRDINDLSDNQIYVGQALWIPAGRQALAPATLTAVRERRRIQPSHAQSREWYWVRNGDTLWDLSRRQKQDIADLRRWNNLRPGEPLHTGQRLRVAPPAGREPLLHRVQPQDSLDTIATNYQVSVDELRRWNQLGYPRLNADDLLIVFAPSVP